MLHCVEALTSRPVQNVSFGSFGLMAAQACRNAAFGTLAVCHCYS